ncbi:MAG: hypothetical protein WD053_10035 [Gracilimonas sp.]
MFERSIKSSLTAFLLLIVSVVPNQFINAQDIGLQLEPSATLENTQALSFTGLGLNTDGSGPVLISGFMENLTGETIDNLYMEIKINASKVGDIIELRSYSTLPFSLSPNQSVYVTNNDLANERIPGIDQQIRFSGGFTPEGDEFIENLSGSTALPRDIYTVGVIIFRVTNALGRQDLASSIIEIGGGSVASFDESEIYLKTPGDIVGSPAEITNPYPQFSWEGAGDVSYRLLVVEDNGQDSPESLLQSAKSSSSTDEGGSLLEFENLDITVTGTSFQYPSSGAQALEQGKTYYWRVITSIQSSGDVEELSSEIWSFTLTGASRSAEAPPLSAEVESTIIELIGQEAYTRLKADGFTLMAVEYDGQEFTGPAATVQLEELLLKIRDEEIILGGNQ